MIFIIQAINMKDNKKLITKLLKEETESPSGYEKIKSLLSNDLINHAEVMRQLKWGGDEATNRSLFKKKLDMSPNDAGGVYRFDEEDIQKISDILMRMSSQIRKTIGHNGRG